MFDLHLNDMIFFECEYENCKYLNMNIDKIIISYNITNDKFLMFYIGIDYEHNDREFRERYPEFVNEVLDYVNGKGEI